MEVPVFAEDSTEQTLDEDDELSNSSVKGAIKWEKREGEYVFLWYQSPFYVATANGGYSMTASLLEDLPDHLNKVWVVDEDSDAVRLFERRLWDEGGDDVLEPDDPRFNNVAPERQIAVDIQQALETHDLDDVESVH